MNELDWLLLAYELNKNGNNRILSLDEVMTNNLNHEHKVSWIHLNATHAQSEEWLKANSRLDPIVVEALLAEETRPRISETEHGVVIILRGVNLNNNAEPEDMVSIRLFINNQQIISVRKRRLKGVVAIENELLHGGGPKTSGEFLEKLIEHLILNMEPAVATMNKHIDDVEEVLPDAVDIKDREQLAALRRQATIFKRYLSPQKEVLEKLKNSNFPWLSKINKRNIHEDLEHLIRFIEDIDEIKERAQIVHDELRHSSSERLNRNMYIITVFSAIFLPLSFLTGLFGVNLAGIPKASDPWSFPIFTAFIILCTLIFILVFKKLKLIR